MYALVMARPPSHNLGMLRQVTGTQVWKTTVGRFAKATARCCYLLCVHLCSYYCRCHSFKVSTAYSLDVDLTTVRACRGLHWRRRSAGRRRYAFRRTSRVLLQWSMGNCVRSQLEQRRCIGSVQTARTAH